MSEFKEPWRDESNQHGSDIRDASGEALLWTSDDGSFVKIDPKHVARIVACVNFCRDLPTEFLERHDIIGGIDTGFVIDLKSNHRGRDPLIETAVVRQPAATPAG